MTTIRKAAKAAGVSVATVSRALSHPEKVSEKARLKVEAAIKEVGYKPNLLSRNFRAAKSFSVVVIVPNIANPFFSSVITGIEKVARDKGYAVLLGNTHNEIEREDEHCKLVETRQADGIITLSGHMPANLLQDGVPSYPIVNACEFLPDAPYPTVVVDNKGAMQTIVEHLTNNSHKRIALITGPSPSTLTQDRMAGYQIALEASGIAFDDSLVLEGDYSMASGQRLAKDILAMKPMPTAIACMNDEMAIGIKNGLTAKGLRVPDDISITGFDDIEYAAYASPSITTMRQPTEKIGAMAMTLMLEQLDGAPPKPENHILPAELIVRASTKDIT